MDISAMGMAFNATDSQPRKARVIRSGGGPDQELLLSEVVYVLAELRGAGEDGRTLYLVVRPKEAAAPYIVKAVRYGS